MRLLERIFTPIGHFTIFFFRLIIACFRRPFRITQIIEQCEFIGLRSVLLTLASNAAIGAIFTMQLVSFQRQLGLEDLAGQSVGLSLTRELAPVITAVMLIGKNGSAMTAEIGSMKITEQLDAMHVMHVNPIHYLGVPRLIASTLMFPVLTAIANISGIIASFITATAFFDVFPQNFLFYLYRGVTPTDILSGILKSIIMGAATATICCYYGFYISRGAKSVGTAATKAVVASSLTILIIDYFLTGFFLRFFYEEWFL